MSCICQYVLGATPAMNGGGGEELVGFPLPNANENEATAANGNEDPRDPTRTSVTDDMKISTCISELVNTRAENWLLKKQLTEHEVTIQNLEQLMTTMTNKQHQILSEMFQLRKRNRELQTECNLQREYHSIERDALIKELHDFKTQKSLLVSGNYNRDNFSYTYPQQSAEEDELKHSSEIDSDLENCRYKHDSDGEEHYSDEDQVELDSDDDKQSGSSAESTAESSHNNSNYSTYSDTSESESENLDPELEHEQEYGTRTGTESD